MGDESSSGGAGTTEPGGGSSEGEWETGEGVENPGGETGEDGQNPGGGDSGDGGDGGQNPGGGDSGDGGENTDDGTGDEWKTNGNKNSKRNKNIGDLSGGNIQNDNNTQDGNSSGRPGGWNDQYNGGKTTTPSGTDPLLVDLDGNGIQTTSIYDGYMMDHEADGFAELSAWVGGNDGILAYDKNGNGIIDNGNEIFGDNYIKSDGTKASSGFDALSDLDSNNDGLINSSDEKFSDLQVIKADGSIVSASDAGIASINLASQQTNQSPDANGNTALSTGTFTTTDGETNSIADYALDVNKTYSIETDKVEIPDEIAA